MLVLDPLVVLVKQLPTWAIALGGLTFAFAAMALAQRTKSKSSMTPRKIHSLGTAIPIFGDMLESQKQNDRRHDWFSDVSLGFNNEPWQVNIPGTPRMIVLSDPASIEAVTTSQFDKFGKDGAHRELMHDLMGDGIVNADGEEWFHQRKTAAKFFTARTLRVCMTNTMQRNIEQVYKVLDAQCGTGRLANLSRLFNQFTLQTFMEVGVGIDNPIIGSTEPNVVDALDEVAKVIAGRKMLPHYVWKLQKWLNVGPEKTVNELTGRIHTHMNHLVEQALSTEHKPTSGQNESENIRTAVELFVEHSSEDTAGLRPRDLADFAKIREELATKLKPLGVGPGGYITAEHVKHLVYLEAVIKETLRFHPTGPLVSRKARQDTVIDGDIFIRKGDLIGMSVYAMARNPRVWGPDAAEFKPERWINDKTGELLVFPSTKFFTFSAGPRQCIGMKLAMLNLRVLSANLIHRYRFTFDPNDGSYVSTLVLPMKQSLLTKVERV